MYIHVSDLKNISPFFHMNTLIDRPGVVAKKHARVIYNDIWTAQTCLMPPQSVAIES